MIEQAGVTVFHNPSRSTTTLTDFNRNHAFELDHGGFRLNPDKAERAMFRAYFLGGTIGLVSCFGAECIRHCRRPSESPGNGYSDPALLEGCETA
jgi:hypothetical protein